MGCCTSASKPTMGCCASADRKQEPASGNGSQRPASEAVRLKLMSETGNLQLEKVAEIRRRLTPDSDVFDQSFADEVAALELFNGYYAISVEQGAVSDPVEGSFLNLDTTRYYLDDEGKQFVVPVVTIAWSLDAKTSEKILYWFANKGPHFDPSTSTLTLPSIGGTFAFLPKDSRGKSLCSTSFYGSIRNPTSSSDPVTMLEGFNWLNPIPLSSFAGVYRCPGKPAGIPLKLSTSESDGSKIDVVYNGQAVSHFSYNTAMYVLIGKGAGTEFLGILGTAGAAGLACEIFPAKGDPYMATTIPSGMPK